MQIDTRVFQHNNVVLDILAYLFYRGIAEERPQHFERLIAVDARLAEKRPVDYRDIPAGLFID